MEIKIDDLKINYEIYGENNKDSVLILHGWGANVNTVKPIANALLSKFKVYSVDFPGFGKSDEPQKDMTVDDYALIVKKFLEILNIEHCILIGHSFGGRVITKLVTRHGYVPKKIVFVDAAGVKPKRKFSYYFKVYSYKLTKAIIKTFNSKERAEELIAALRKNVGSDDYKNASDNMKKTFVNVVNEDLTYLLKEISVPTLLIWGENDEDTPIRDAKIFEKNIKGSGLVILKGAGHYSYIDKFREFSIILNKFLEEEE